MLRCRIFFSEAGADKMDRLRQILILRVLKLKKLIFVLIDSLLPVFDSSMECVSREMLRCMRPCRGPRSWARRAAGEPK